MLLGRELLHPVVEGVGHIQVTFLVNRQAAWNIELARLIARLAETL